MSQNTLTAANVTCAIPTGTGARIVFDGLTMHLNAGEVVDLTGPSGSGKSSLLTALAQLNPHARATLTLRGRGSSAFTLQQWRRQVAYVPQTATLIGDDVAEAIRMPWKLVAHGSSDGVFRLTRRADALPASAPDNNRIREALDAAGCTDIELSRPVTDISGGQAARVSLLRTLLTSPAVLLADEVDAGLDAENAAKVARMLLDAAARGMAVCRISHRGPDGTASRQLTLDSRHLTEQVTS